MKRYGCILGMIILLLCFSSFADTLILPESLLTIEEEAFMGDMRLDEVVLPDGVVSILDNAFAESSLRSIYLPASLEFIADSAFDVGVSFEAEPGTYASDWINQHTAMRFTEDSTLDSVIDLALFEDNYDFGNGLHLSHNNTFGVYMIDDFFRYKSMLEGMPTWWVEKTDGDGELSCQPWDNGMGCGIEVTGYPNEPSSLTYRVCCAWGDQFLSTQSTIHFVYPSSLPSWADIPDRIDMQVGQTTTFDMNLDDCFSGYKNAAFCPTEGDWNIETDQFHVTATPWEEGIWSVYTGVSVANIQLWKETLIVVADQDGNIPKLIPMFDETKYEKWLPVLDSQDGPVQCDDWIGYWALTNTDTLSHYYGGAPEWSIVLKNGEDLQARIEPDEPGAAQMFIDRRPEQEGDSVYRITCTWGNAESFFDAVIHCCEYRNLPSGVSVEKPVFATTGVATEIHAWFDSWEQEGEIFLWSQNEKNPELWTDGDMGYFRAWLPGIYSIGGMVRSDGIVGYFITEVVVLEENVPIQAEAIRTDCYAVGWLPVESTASYTVNVWLDEACTRLYRTVETQTNYAEIYTDVDACYWFSVDPYAAVTTAPIPPLAAPEITEYDADDYIHIAWEPVTGAYAYRLYWSFNEWTPETEWLPVESTYCDELPLQQGISIWICGESEFGPGARTAIIVNPETDNVELIRAADLGIGSLTNINRTITFAEYARMMDRIIELTSHQRLSKWQTFYAGASQSSVGMTRREGMVGAYLAAESMGSEYYTYNYFQQGYQIYQEIASVDDWGFWNDMHAGNYSLFPNVYDSTLNGEDSYINAGYFYAMYRVSASGRIIFDYDANQKSLHPSDPMTYGEGMLAAIRIYDSYTEVRERYREKTEADITILDQADARREEILNSETNVIVSGTCYYVSNAGNDLYDGKSPNRPWATLDRVNKMNFRPGDGVLFHRGDTWRGSLTTQSCVTYSAYGSGPKPEFYGSPENGSGSGNWQLLSGTSNIWVYHIPMMDCGDIVVDGSMEVFERAPVWWTGSRYVSYSTDDTHDDLMAKLTFDPSRDLKNHEYFCDIDWSDLGDTYPIYVFSYVDRTGPMYLRCDEGNPGLLYNSLEFCCDPKNGSLVVSGFSQDVVLDNLCIRYAGHAMEFSGGSAVVQNCEVGYMGAMTHTFYWDLPNYSGDGIIHGNNMRVENNYVHHVYNSGIAPGELSFAAEQDYADTVDIQGNNLVRHNLLERTSGIVLINWEEEANTNHLFRDITIEDNYVLYSQAAGDATKTKTALATGALLFSDLHAPLPCVNENIQVKDNVFYCADVALIISGMSDEYIPVYSGNTFAQYEGVPFLYWLFEDGSFRAVYDNVYSDVETFIREHLGDLTAIVLH